MGEAEGVEVEDGGRGVGGVKNVGLGLEGRRRARGGRRLWLGAGVCHAQLGAELAVARLGRRLVHQSCTLRRLAEMMPELKPPQESSECRRPNSIFGQRSITTVSPAARARSAALWLTTPSCIHKIGRAHV